jgi:hypothetical protein
MLNIMSTALTSFASSTLRVTEPQARASVAVIPTPTTNGSTPGATLNSWKEIATYLGRGVRTVQRWERELGLPVHRIRNSDHSPVFAFASELRLWVQGRAGENGQQVRTPETVNAPSGTDHVNRTRSALMRSHELTRELARHMVEHCNRTETLRRSLETTLAKIPRRRPTV